MRFSTLAFVGACFVSGASVHAAVVTWGPAATIAGDADVSLAGTSVYAYTFGDEAEANTVVNGVSFTAVPIPFNSAPITVGPMTVRETNGPLWGLDFGGSAAAPYTSLSTGYRSMLRAFASAGVVESVEVTMGGLTIGQTYQVQAWSNASSSDGTLVSRLDNSTLLDTNTTDTAGGLGQYATGTFVADATSQIFALSAEGGDINVGPFNTIPALNGFQLRDVTIPEPASLAILATAGLLLARRRR